MKARGGWNWGAEPIPEVELVAVIGESAQRPASMEVVTGANAMALQPPKVGGQAWLAGVAG